LLYFIIYSFRYYLFLLTSCCYIFSLRVSYVLSFKILFFLPSYLLLFLLSPLTSSLTLLLPFSYPSLTLLLPFSYPLLTLLLPSSYLSSHPPLVSNFNLSIFFKFGVRMVWLKKRWLYRGDLQVSPIYPLSSQTVRTTHTRKWGNDDPLLAALLYSTNHKI
jgi:hypothetical protein